MQLSPTPPPPSLPPPPSPPDITECESCYLKARAQVCYPFFYQSSFIDSMAFYYSTLILKFSEVYNKLVPGFLFILFYI